MDGRHAKYKTLIFPSYFPVPLPVLAVDPSIELQFLPPLYDRRVGGHRALTRWYQSVSICFPPSLPKVAFARLLGRPDPVVKSLCVATLCSP